MSKLGAFKKLDVRKEWPNEARDFTPWLAQESNMEELSKALGIELEVETVEATVGPYSADILAKDTATGQYVVIENQLEKTNHDHLGKAITYGSVLGASAIVWVASEFTEEHHRALEWLNDHTTDDLAFYGVVVELWKIDESLPALRLNVISRPTQIKPIDATGLIDQNLSDTRKLQLEFWTVFRDKLLEAGVVASTQKPRGQYWFDVPLGRSGISLSNIANTSEGRVGVRVYLYNTVATQALDQLLQQKDAIETELGEHLLWNPNPDARDKVIALQRDTDIWNREEWPAAIEWLVDRVAKFRKTFMPRIKKLKLTKAVPGDTKEMS